MSFLISFGLQSFGQTLVLLCLVEPSDCSTKDIGLDFRIESDSVEQDGQRGSRR